MTFAKKTVMKSVFANRSMAWNRQYQRGYAYSEKEKETFDLLNSSQIKSIESKKEGNKSPTLRIKEGSRIEKSSRRRRKVKSSLRKVTVRQIISASSSSLSLHGNIVPIILYFTTVPC